ncbi:hypothetical protein BFW38_08460 [Terasakiispira papahanaumokuakeensis]|uniref:Rhodanese domain-containing protein n=1 Tax=Terasakiispira papahanaumokuakeensis TaxID=197479 RepID=A0A1E2VA99_9GAMM|nr:rhodanese-like domain-containing protein [Terasakiispira papahanaumokuakeensis]ODC03575.1 hypothetical protein BFW38_08460 [Terasakiispira papahanaumokuakeensis]
MHTITPEALKSRLAKPDEETAFLDIREFGEYGMGHPFHSVNVPLSRLESLIGTFVPRLEACIVLMDQSDEGRANHAAQQLSQLGYRDVRVLSGGLNAWKAAGYNLFEGVNVVSKTFGELIHEIYHTPSIEAKTLAQWQAEGRAVHILDGRPYREYHKMNIPGSLCCPNGELVKRTPALLNGDHETPIVINCAGRTRSIIGAQTLCWLGLENPVYALENGTQGWRLAGLSLEHGSDRRYPDHAPVPALQASTARALAEQHGARAIDATTVNQWLADTTRTTYVFDVRTHEEFAKAHAPSAIHAPGGQLIQATDHWVGVYRSRLVLVDDDECRAPTVAAWLSLMGVEVVWLAGGHQQWSQLNQRQLPLNHPTPPETIDLETLSQWISMQSVQLLDARPGMQYRQSHLSGSQWINRAHLARHLTTLDLAQPLVLIGDPEQVVGLAEDLKTQGAQHLHQLPADLEAWADHGLALSQTPDQPCDDDCIDFLFFVHDRHDGNLEASKRYLAWEVGLVPKLDDEERATFAIEMNCD